MEVVHLPHVAREGTGRLDLGARTVGIVREASAQGSVASHLSPAK